VWQSDPLSPFSGRALLADGEGVHRGWQSRRGLKLLKAQFSRLPQPQAVHSLDRALKPLGDNWRQRFRLAASLLCYPLNGKRKTRQCYLAAEEQAGEAYPPPMPTAILATRQKLADSAMP